MWGRIDLVLRFVYVALVPFILGVLSSSFPVGGIVGGAAVGTVVAMIGTQRWHARVDNIKFVGRVLGGFGKLGEYYAEHPPKPLLYYILYPALFPYWLFVKSARAEFSLYRGLNAVAFVVIVVTSVIDYLRNWSPLPFSAFIGTGFGVFIIQLAATFAIVMPIVTTVILMNRGGHKRTLVALLVLAALTATWGVVIHKANDGVPFNVRARIKARYKQDPKHSFQAFTEGLNAAYLSLRDHPGELDRATTAAHDALEVFYRRDEASATKLWSGDGILLLYVRLKRGYYLWLARDDHKLLTEPAQISAEAHRQMAH